MFLGKYGLFERSLITFNSEFKKKSAHTWSFPCHQWDNDADCQFHSVYVIMAYKIEEWGLFLSLETRLFQTPELFFFYNLLEFRLLCFIKSKELGRLVDFCIFIIFSSLALAPHLIQETSPFPSLSLVFAAPCLDGVCSSMMEQLFVFVCWFPLGAVGIGHCAKYTMQEHIQLSRLWYFKYVTYLCSWNHKL